MGPRVAVCHEWVTTYGGSEQVARHLADALDASDVFTFTARSELARELFPGRRVHVSPLGRREMAQRHWGRFLALMPSAWDGTDLRGFDLVITSSHAAVNAIRVPVGVPHLSYVHTPMRYAWTWREELGRVPAPLRPVWPLAAAALRRADRGWSRHVDVFVANSANVAARIRAAYRRDAEVVHPPVDLSWWTPPTERSDRAFFLVAGRLVAYKRVAVAIEAARLAHVPLVVAGDGPELRSLRELARGADVGFVVAPTREQLRELYRSARALVVPGVEDFGMTMVEAQACGTPVLALGIGGAREAVVDGGTGWLLDDERPEAFAAAMLRCEPDELDPAAIRAHASRFDVPTFHERIRAIAARALAGDEATPVDLVR